MTDKAHPATAWCAGAHSPEWDGCPSFRPVRLGHCTPIWGGHSPACLRDGTYCSLASTHDGPCHPHDASPLARLTVPEGWLIRRYDATSWELLHDCGDDPSSLNNIVTIDAIGDDLYEVDGEEQALAYGSLQGVIDYIVGDHERVGCAAG